MSSIISYFMKPYVNASFMRQQQARIFLFFIGGAFLLLVAQILSYVIIIGEGFFTGTSLFRYMYCILCFICLILLGKGQYAISSNLAIFCSIILSLINNFITANTGNISTVTILFFFYVFVIMGTVFGNRLTIILSSVLNITSGFIIISPSTFDKKEKMTLLVAFIIGHLFISLLCYLYQVIVRATIMKIEEHSKLSNMLSSGRDISDDLKEISDRLNSDNQSLSQRTTQQASAIKNISESLELAVHNIVETTNSTDKARELASNATEIAKDGTNLIEEAVNSINEINRSSREINKITTLLNEVAFQTNLLSINGAIEAAHAGENGVGFGIVAGEVRDLAIKSRNAAKEIEALVADSISKINQGTEIIANSGTVFSRIRTSVETVSDLIQQISSRSQNQRSSIEQINEAIAKMDVSTRENSQMADNTSMISDTLSERAVELITLLRKTENKNEIAQR